jgi:NADH dehydrogenase
MQGSPESSDAPHAGLPRIVIIGAGFGGLSAAKALAKAKARIILIDRRNHHLFQPLLYQVATAGLSPNQIATPIRTIVRRQKNTEVILGAVSGVDLEGKAVLVGARRVAYDYLIVATGAAHSYFGHDAWAEAAPGVKSLEDAIDVRRRILLAFERAEIEPDPGERARLLNFVIIGAGPTGVELAGAIAELARKALAMDFRNVNPRSARIILVEAGPRVLAQFHPALSRTARRALERLGVELRLGQAVTGCDGEAVTLASGERIETRCALWAAGVQSSPAAAWLGLQADRQGRAFAAPDLTAPGHREVFVIGDCAHVKDERGNPLPALAPVAKQQGAYAARAILRALAGRAAPAPFAYVNAGELATIGRHAAVVDFGAVRLTGLIGWLVWSAAHIYFLIGFRNRVAVALDWLWSYLTFERGARLITGPINGPIGAPAGASSAKDDRAV